MTLVLHGMRIAAHAPTPAFNLHDHYMLAGAVLTAVRAIDGDATSVEVGSFAGHTAIFSRIPASAAWRGRLRGQAALRRGE